MDVSITIMQWSKTKKQFESLLASSLRKRVQVHVTEYTKSSIDIGRGWFTLDGKDVVSIQIPSFYDNNIKLSTETMDFGQAIRTYLNISIEEAVLSNDPLIKGFVFLDKRFGKRKLNEINMSNLHEFSKVLYVIRCNAEGIKC